MEARLEMVKLKSLRRFGKRFFWVSRCEVAEVKRLAKLSTVTDAMRLLFPRLAFYKCARGHGYWGRES